MKALTLWQPWAYAITHLGKRIENRPWAAPPSVVGQDLALHAGGTYDPKGHEYIEGLGLELPYLAPNAIVHYAIVAVVRVVRTYGSAGQIEDEEQRRRWFFGPYGWLLEDVRVLPRPVPCKGKQGIWNTTSADHHEIHRQLEELHGRRAGT